MILVTGASGYIGQKLLQQLKTQRVAVLSRDPQKNRSSFPGITIIEGDLLDSKSLVGKFDKIERVIHLASLTHSLKEAEYFRVNVEGTKNLIKALPKNLKQFVYASTTCAESDAGGYGESKLQAEQLLKKTFSNYTILRIADVYGGAGEKSLEQLIHRCQKALVFPMVGNGNYQMAPVHVDDVIFSLVKSLDLQGQHTFIIAGLEKTTLANLVGQIKKMLKKSNFQLLIPVFLFQFLIIIASKFGVGGVFPDQVKRLTVVKDLNSQSTWEFFHHQPKQFSGWLKAYLRQA